MCRKQLKKYDEAKKDLTFVVKTEPKNTEAIKELDVIEELIVKFKSESTIKESCSVEEHIPSEVKKAEQLPSEVRKHKHFTPAPKSSIIEPINKPPDERSRVSNLHIMLLCIDCKES